MEFWLHILQYMVLFFALLIVLGFLTFVVIFIIDKTQTGDAIRRNYPVIGRFRSLFTDLGEFFRQYFFAMDREELPFNRAQRDWVERAAIGSSNTVAFGSTRSLTVPGTPIFINDPFPPLDNEYASMEPMLIGAECRTPYLAPSFFNLSGMSFGALSRPAVEALSRGAAEANIWMNTGEGGLSPYHLEGGGDIVFQIGTAKYGVRDADGNLSDDKLSEIAAHENVRMFEIKMAQGAKPGKGGMLPGAKVTPEIAKIRGIPEGKDSLSPNRHVEMTSFDDMLDMVAHVREVTGKPVGVKIVVASKTVTREMFTAIAARVKDAPDFITIDGGEGGTGAAPMPLLDLVGMSVREAVPLVCDIRDEFGLKDRIRLIASGKLVNPGDVAWALCAGADFVTSARGFLFSLGCIQAMKCNKNTCPTGITTHDPGLQKGLVVERKYRRVARYAKALMHEVEIIARTVGVSEPRKMRRRHVRLVQSNGRSVAMNEIQPSYNSMAES